MSDLIERQKAIDAIEEMQMPIMRSEFSGDQFKFSGMAEALQAIKELPSAQETLSDGTLQITVDNDISTVDRILLSQSGTHYGNLYYTDEAQPERKTASWEVLYRNHTYKFHCSECGANHRAMYDYCPSCGAYMWGERNEID